jgi:hypothetical protein
MTYAYRTKFLLVALVASTAACAGTARGPDAYRADTSRLLETRNSQLQECYTSALKADDKLAGTVTVQFVVEKHTGAIENASVESDKTTAPSALRHCVLQAVEGLVLAPPDRHEGRATFVYEFKAAPSPKA